MTGLGRQSVTQDNSQARVGAGLQASSVSCMCVVQRGRDRETDLILYVVHSNALAL